MKITYQKLNKLGDQKFESLCKTLLLKIIGSGVTPFSKGKDGAREATFFGKANYPSKALRWNNAWIFQVKFSDIEDGLDKARKQVKYLIDKELSKLEDYKYIQDNKCENYIYITNIPFTGEANKGLHDYINKKKQKYKIKNFDYWDGEKISHFLNAYSSIRETYFPSAGIETLSEDELDEISTIYEPPFQYEQIKELLLKNKIVAIIGDPHVGKTTTAKFLAKQLTKEIDLTSVFQIPLIENIHKIPLIENSVIIFDDLFGDISYEGIGQGNKILRRLYKNNYLIITSRGYIYDEAKKKGKVDEEIQSIPPQLIQEGSYSTEKLYVILSNHLKIRRIKERFNKKTYKLILSKKNTIVNELRFPHNIDVFVQNIQEEIDSKKDLNKLIHESKTIEKVILGWISRLPESYRKLLFISSVSKTLSVDDLTEINKLLNFTSDNEIVRFLNKVEKILFVQSGYIVFKHPSFKLCSYKNLSEKFPNLKKYVVYNLIIKGNSRLVKNIKIKLLLQETIKDFTVDDILTLMNSKYSDKDILMILWAQLIKKNFEMSYKTILSLETEKKKKKKRFIMSLAAAKGSIKKDKLLKFILFLINKRTSENSKIINNIVVYLSYGVREHIFSILDKLEDGDIDERKLKIELLGALGTKSPKLALDSLLIYLNSSYTKVRRKVYSSLNMIDLAFLEKVKENLIQLQQTETNSLNKIKIDNLLKRIEGA
jgi:DNA polymerase III delta prime subunit